MDLLKNYKDNVLETDYYYKFYEYLIIEPEKQNKELNEVFGLKEDISDDFEVYDEEDAIGLFLKLIMPPETRPKKDNREYLLLSYYLKENGYKINKFPRILERPTSLYDFAYTEIRNKIQLERKENGSVSWNERRAFISKLEFTKDNIKHNLEEGLEEKFKLISTRKAVFDKMPIDERLKEIANMMEFIGKENGKYINLDYETLTFELISKEKIIEFKKKIQCFRHAIKESLLERNSYSENEKKFFVDYGILFCNLSYLNTKKENKRSTY